MRTMDTTETFTPLRTVWEQDVIGIIETRRNSAGSLDGGVVAYRERGVDGDHCYAVHTYGIEPETHRVILSNGIYRLSRKSAMERLLERARLQGQGMFDPTLG